MKYLFINYSYFRFYYYYLQPDKELELLKYEKMFEYF